MDNGGGFMHWVSSSSSSPAYTHQMVDPTVLKLGKRQYYTAASAAAAAGEGVRSGAGGGVKRAAPSNGAVIPRCQVEGCGKSLADAKDYHRRHKVCQVHAKAPNVVVLGTEQRFCQQCSRFHAISEFDDSKRSCRRRLAGHNERRRKSNSSSSDSSAASRSTIGLETAVTGGRFPYLSAETSPGRALSLLSSSPALSSQSNAALRELIAENRSALLARQLFSSNGTWRNHVGGYSSDRYVNMISFASHQSQEVGGQGPSPHFGGGWHRFQESGNDHLTLDLMQNAAPNCTSFEFDLSGRNKSEEEEECCEIWKSLQGTHVV